MFDITKCPIIDGYKRCKTRDGRDVRILCEDMKHDTHTIVGMVTTAGKESTCAYMPDGSQDHMGRECELDLVNIPIKKNTLDECV